MSTCFKFDKIEIKLTSFSNDVTFLVKNMSLIKRILKIMKTFGTFSVSVTFEMAFLFQVSSPNYLKSRPNL